MKNKKMFFFLSFFVFSLMLTLTGIFLGDLEEGILQKAISICYECIGIG